MDGFSEHGNEPSGSIKYCEILEQLYNRRLLEKGSSRGVSLEAPHILQKGEEDEILSKDKICTEYS
jgi:hypothetical protein